MLRFDNYFTIFGWMVTDLQLKGIERDVFAIIFSFTQDDEQWYKGGTRYLSEFLGISRRSVLNALASLTERGLLKKEVSIINGVTYCSYKAECREFHGGCKNFTGGGEKSGMGGGEKSGMGGGEKISPNNTELIIQLGITKEKEKIDKRKENSQPIAEIRERINALYHRRATTAWSDKETAQLKIIAKRPEALDELSDIEKWHSTPNGKQFGRHDVITLLNNFSTEVDRARAFLANPNQPSTQLLGTDGKPLNAYNDPRNPLAFAGGHFSGKHEPPTTEMNF